MFCKLKAIDFFLQTKSYFVLRLPLKNSAACQNRNKHFWILMQADKLHITAMVGTVQKILKNVIFAGFYFKKLPALSQRFTEIKPCWDIFFYIFFPKSWVPLFEITELVRFNKYLTSLFVNFRFLCQLSSSRETFNLCSFYNIVGTFFLTFTCVNLDLPKQGLKVVVLSLRRKNRGKNIMEMNKYKSYY